jgi:nucleoid DNA-binding protein
MNKSEIIEDIATKTGTPKVRVAAYVNTFMETIQEALIRGDKVTISGFGTFTVSERKSFQGHNPKSGASIKVPARRIPVFRAGKELKALMNE